MTASLRETEIERYRRDGFLFPVPALSPSGVGEYRAAVEALSLDFPAGSLPRPLEQYLRAGAHLVLPFVARIARAPAILDAVQGLLGPDLLVWSCELLVEGQRSTAAPGWPRDPACPGPGGADREVCAWVALTPVTTGSGCMRFVRGSHRRDAASGGAGSAVEVDEAEATPVVLAPGEMSLHHGRVRHAPGEDRDGEPRIGVAIRYLAAPARRQDGERDYAMLVRGMDRGGRWVHVAPPERAFGETALACYEEVMAARAKAVGRGGGPVPERRAAAEEAQPERRSVAFTRMEEGTAEEYALLRELEEGYVARTADRLLAALEAFEEDSLDGYRVSRLTHALQSASRAWRDGADIDWVVGALLHDIGDGLAPRNHDEMAAAILAPFVREEVAWTVRHHGAFQMYYYAHHYGWNRDERERFRGHRCFEACAEFCERWDQASFDPDYPTLPLAFFAPMVREVFARHPRAPGVVGAGESRPLVDAAVAASRAALTTPGSASDRRGAVS